jgi:Flp pilus assembly protein protease CpaA
MRLPGYVIAWFVTVALEVPCVAAFYPGQRVRMALVCLVATSATNLAMNLFLPRWLGSGQAFLLTGEILALALEAAIYSIASHPKNLARALMASALANGLSFSAGLVLPIAG